VIKPSKKAKDNKGRDEYKRQKNNKSQRQLDSSVEDQEESSEEDQPYPRKSKNKKE
jgi:hypothetical protein